MVQELTEVKPKVVEEVVSAFSPNTEVMRAYDMLMLVRDMKARSMFPSIFFQLNTYRCMELFMGLLDLLEKREVEEYPDHYKDLEKAKKEQEMRRAAREKQMLAKAAAKARKTYDEDGNLVHDDGDKGGGDDPNDQVIEVRNWDSFPFSCPTDLRMMVVSAMV